MNFGEAQESLEVQDRKVYLGKRTFKVLAVNPTEEWMKDKKIYISEKEFERNGFEKDRSDETKDVAFARVDIFIQDASDEEANILKVSYKLNKKLFVSKDKSKCQIINRYGDTLWVPFEEAKTMNISNPNIGTNPYLLDSARPAYLGEDNLVKFIRALRNLNSVNYKSTEEDKIKFMSMFEVKDLEKLFSGNFSELSKLIMSGDCKVGFLLGARTSDKGDVYQDLFRDLPLKEWVVSSKKSEYLIKKVQDAQAAGMYKNTYFDFAGINTYKEYNDSITASSSAIENELFSAAKDDFADFDSPSLGSDDLPF